MHCYAPGEGFKFAFWLHSEKTWKILSNFKLLSSFANKLWHFPLLYKPDALSLVNVQVRNESVRGRVFARLGWSRTADGHILAPPKERWSPPQDQRNITWEKSLDLKSFKILFHYLDFSVPIPCQRWPMNPVGWMRSSWRHGWPRTRWVYYCFQYW